MHHAQTYSARYGLKLLSLWLIITRLTGLIHLQFAGLTLVMAALAIVAGVLIAMER